MSATPDTITAAEWAARKARAEAFLATLKAEWELAREKRRPPAYIHYDYTDATARGTREGASDEPTS
jgi:hypothetical protein